MSALPMSDVLKEIDEPTSRTFATRTPLLWAVTTAVLLGAGWGGLSRVWMRYISDDPSSTTGGTAYIVAAPTLIWLARVLATRSLHWTAARRRAARVVAFVPTLLLGMAAGILMFPTLVLGSIAYGRRTWLWPIRVLLVVAAAAPIIAVADEIPEHRTWSGLAWYLVLVVTIVPTYAAIYHPRSVGEPLWTRRERATPVT